MADNNFTKSTPVAYLNVSIQDKDGNWLPLPKGIPLRADGRAIEQGLIQFGTEEKLDQLVKEGKIKLNVNAAQSDAKPAAL